MHPALKLSLDGFEFRNHSLLRSDPPDGESSALVALPINRVSFGPYIFRSLIRKFADIADVLLTTGDYSCFSDTMSRAEVGEYPLREHE